MQIKHFLTTALYRLFHVRQDNSPHFFRRDIGYAAALCASTRSFTRSFS